MAKKEFTLNLRPDQAEKLADLLTKISQNAAVKYLLKRSNSGEFTVQELKGLSTQLKNQLKEEIPASDPLAEDPQ